MENAQQSQLNDRKEYQEPYGLHIQCGLRVLNGKALLACSDDMYIPAPSFEGSSFQFDLHKSLFDQNMQAYLSEHGDSRITEVRLYDFGDVVLELSDKSSIHIYANSTESDVELWRFMAGDEQPHLIRSPNEYTYS